MPGASAGKLYCPFASVEALFVPALGGTAMDTVAPGTGALELSRTTPDRVPAAASCTDTGDVVCGETSIPDTVTGNPLAPLA